MLKLKLLNKNVLRYAPIHPLLRIPSFLNISNHYWQYQYPKYVARISQQQLERLQTLAEKFPDDPKREAMYMEGLLQACDPQEVVRRYLENPKLAMNDEVYSKYLAALEMISGKKIKLESEIERQQNAPQKTEKRAKQIKHKTPPLEYTQITTPKEFMQAIFDPQFSGEMRKGTPHNPVIVREAISSENKIMDRFASFLRFIHLILLIFLFYSLYTNIKSSQSGPGGEEGLSMFMSADFKPIQNTEKTFDDIRGIDEVKDEIQEIVEFLKNPDKYNKLGGKLPKGVLLVGKPGTGKTLIAKAIAGEAGRPFFYACGSSFDDMIVGVGARRIRSLFAAARKHAPCIIFLDEIDSLGGKRTSYDSHYSKQTLNQLLSEMDGFQSSEGIIVIGATNFIESLDPALLRPGRFDKHITVPVPDIAGREDILKLYLEYVPHRNLDIKTIAKKTRGFTGADIWNMVNQAAIRASLLNKKYVEMDEMEYSFDKIVLGLENKSTAKTLTPQQNKIIAYHESGHALVALLSKKQELHKLTILPRGSSLGVTISLPPESPHMTKSDYFERIDQALGGTVAEEVILGKENITSGATSDIKVATNIARQMVMRFGMSDLGYIDLTNDDNYFEKLSYETKREIDKEVQKIINERYQHVKRLLYENKDKLDCIANALLQYETLTGKEVNSLLAGKPIRVDGANSIEW